MTGIGGMGVHEFTSKPAYAENAAKVVTTEKVNKTDKAESNREIEFPEWWPAGKPLPKEKSNCVICHVTAGRELSLAVIDYTYSVHDREALSCFDCHGGNTEDDDLAHDERFDFIGTKLSAHQAVCAECHEGPADQLAKGAHHWDFTKRINTEYPMCIDCHGNHDVGNPPADFTLMDVCLDCHEDLESKYKGYTKIVRENDRLWEVLRKVRAKSSDKLNPVPERFRKELRSISRGTRRYIHSVRAISDKKVTKLNRRVAGLRSKLEAWLAEPN